MRALAARLGQRLSKILSSAAEERTNVASAPALIAQPLEERRVLTVGLDELAPLTGTLNSGGEWDTADPTISGTVEGVAVDHTIRIDFDFDGDGNSDDYLIQDGSDPSFEYDPRLLMPELTGSFVLKVQATDLGLDGLTPLDSSGWESITMNVGTQLAVEDFAYAKAPGDNDDYIFTGHVVGPNAANALVEFSAAFTDSVEADADGYFTYVRALPNGVTGELRAIATDSQSNTAQCLIDVNIADPTPTFLTLDFEETTGGEYRFFGLVSGPYVSGATLDFSGLCGGTATVNSDGTFSFTASFSEAKNETLYVTATDERSHVGYGSLYVEIPDPNA